MKNYQNFRAVIRRIATSVPASMKVSLQFWKVSENIIGNAAVKSSAESTPKALPRSYRALKKLEPDQVRKFLRQKRPFSIGAFALLAFPVTTFGLGVWQVGRRRQKLVKINELQANLTKEPATLPEDLRELDKMEFMPVKVVGEFCHDEELIIKPRHRHDVFKVAGIQSDPYGRVNEVGAHVITPFKLADRHYKILIQRGWVPLSHMEPATREQAQTKGQIEIVGLVRGNEKRPKFVPENDPLEGEWHYRDVEMMARMRNCAPVYLEAIKSTTVRGGPIGGQTILQLRNEHLSYIMTWFSLSAISGWLWYRRYIRPLPIL